MKITPPPKSATSMPGGPAGGDLSGSFPSPVVHAINGVEITGTPAAGDEIIATSATAASWQTPPASGLSSITDGTTTITPVTDLTVPPHSLSGTTPNADIAWDRLVTVAAAGSTETLDISDGDTFDVTLTADCTMTLAGATTGRSSAMSVVTRQDGTGGWDLTWPGSVSWLGVTPAPDTSPGAVNAYVLWSFDGGTSWGGTLVGGSNITFDATAPADIGGVGVASSVGVATTAPRRDHVHALTYHDEPLTDGASNFIFDGGDIVVVTGVPN